MVVAKVWRAFDGDLGNIILSVPRGAGGGPRQSSGCGLIGRKYPKGIDAAA